MNEFYEKLINWFKKNKRSLPWRKNRTPYSVWISEIMLQQTQAKTVIPYYQKWMKIFPRVEAVNKASLSQILKEWQGLGYYSRAKKIKQASKIIVEKFNAFIPADYQSLIRLPGIGEYTAKAILNFAFKKNYLAIDTNVYRIFSRLFLISESITQSQTKRIINEYSAQLTKNKSKVYRFNEALFDLGNFICQKKPLCLMCPVEKYCQANLEKKTHLFPKIKIKKNLKVVSLSFLIKQKNKYLFFLRKEESRLNNFWELPTLEHTTIDLKEIPLIKKAVIEKYNFAIKEFRLLKNFTHYYTKYKINHYLAEAKALNLENKTDKIIPSRAAEGKLFIKGFFSLAELKQIPVTKPIREFLINLPK